MSIKQNIKFNITDEMLNDSKDFLDSVEVTTIALECKKLKQKEDEVEALEEQLKNKKAEVDDISSRVIPELLAEQGLSEIKLADGSAVTVKKENKGKTNNWPTSMPILKNSSENKRASLLIPMSFKAPANPSPWSKPNPNATTHGVDSYLCFSLTSKAK